jgi:pantoate--beta-alanine ligase
MQLIHSTREISEYLHGIRSTNQIIGFVPTMGALHKGHLALVNKAKEDNDFVVVSVFVNPTQFNNSSDFDNYPNQLELDITLLEQAGVDCVFLPNVDELYPYQSVLKFDFGYLEHVMEGEFRPGHFNGVATVVSKFFNIITPHKAYFGQKDIQQVAVIKMLVLGLSFQLDIVVVPTLREMCGLAMSSRNQRLTDEEKVKARAIYQALGRSRDEFLSGKSFVLVQQDGIRSLESQGFKVEYLELTKSSTLEKVTGLSTGEYAICLAAYLGDVRLIDNLLFIV